MIPQNGVDQEVQMEIGQRPRFSRAGSKLRARRSRPSRREPRRLRPRHPRTGAVYPPRPVNLRGARECLPPFEDVLADPDDRIVYGRIEILPQHRHEPVPYPVPEKGVVPVAGSAAYLTPIERRYDLSSSRPHARTGLMKRPLLTGIPARPRHPEPLIIW